MEWDDDDDDTTATTRERERERERERARERAREREREQSFDARVDDSTTALSPLTLSLFSPSLLRERFHYSLGSPSSTSAVHPKFRQLCVVFKLIILI